MLFTMSFSTELFASVVLGLMAGNVVFLPYNDDEDDDNDDDDDNENEDGDLDEETKKDR